jgi:hypothetical protein
MSFRAKADTDELSHFKAVALFPLEPPFDFLPGLLPGQNKINMCFSSIFARSSRSLIINTYVYVHGDK